MPEGRTYNEWKDSVETIIEMGKYLKDLKAELSQEEFLTKIRSDYAMDISTANKLSSVANHPILSDPRYADRLPKSWALLYELRFLDDDVLLAKIEDGSLKTINKYKIWETRGVKVRSRYEPKGTPKNNVIKVPDGCSLVDYVKGGMREELLLSGFESAEKISAKLQIGVQTYRMIKSIVTLSERGDLNQADRNIIKHAIERINKTRNIRKYYDQVRPIIDKIYGATRNVALSEKTLQKRVDAYRNGIIILCDTCERLANLELPYLSREESETCINDLVEAGKTIRKVAENIRRSKNDC